MSQNIAVLVGNTSYKSLPDLSCCAKDVDQMRALLSATKRFNQLIDCVDQPIAMVRDQLRGLSEIDGGVSEVFFYFSGHGLSNSTDFYMCFDDFNESQPNTTGLSRNDAFELLRHINADLAVVVLDACEAGRNLIKTPESPIGQPLKSGFTDFVQFASCTETQSSMAGHDISVFTDEFVRACLVKHEGAIFYSDIENALRDAFLDRDGQTPHFTRQGTSREKFCSDARLLEDFRQGFLAIVEEDKVTTSSVDSSSPLERARAAIAKIDDQVPTKDDAQRFVDGVFEAAANRTALATEINEFFDVRTVKHNDFTKVMNKQSVVNLLNRRGGSDSFVEGAIEREKRHQFGLLGMSTMAALGYPDEYDDVYYLTNHCGIDSVHAAIYFEPKSMALDRVVSEVVFLPRLTECLVLTCNSREQRSGWGTFNEYDGTKKWRWSHHKWAENPADVATEYVSDPYDFASGYILSFGKSES